MKSNNSLILIVIFISTQPFLYIFQKKVYKISYCCVVVQFTSPGHRGIWITDKPEFESSYFYYYTNVCHLLTFRQTHVCDNLPVAKKILIL